MSATRLGGACLASIKPLIKPPSYCCTHPIAGVLGVQRRTISGMPLMVVSVEEKGKNYQNEIRTAGHVLMADMPSIAGTYMEDNDR